MVRDDSLSFDWLYVSVPQSRNLHVIIYNLIVDTEMYIKRSLTMTQSKDQFDNKTKSFVILDVNLLKKEIV